MSMIVRCRPLLCARAPPSSLIFNRRPTRGCNVVPLFRTFSDQAEKGAEPRGTSSASSFLCPPTYLFILTYHYIRPAIHEFESIVINPVSLPIHPCTSMCACSIADLDCAFPPVSLCHQCACLLTYLPIAEFCFQTKPNVKHRMQLTSFASVQISNRFLRF